MRSRSARPHSWPLGDNSPEYEAAYRKIGSSAGYYDDWQAGRDPVGISTQDDELAARFDPVLGGRKVANFLRVLTLEAQTLARACGKSHVHNLEPEDLVALTIEASLMARVPLAGMQLPLVDEIADRVAGRLAGRGG